MTDEPTFPYVYAREWDHIVTARSPRYEWLQFIVIGPPGTNVPLAVVHMKPALLGGWLFSHVEWQGDEAWLGMAPECVLAWKNQSPRLVSPGSNSGVASSGALMAY